MDGSGAITLTQSFEPFGAPLSSTGAESSEFGFTGEQEEVAGLVFLRARFYDPGSGRFLTKDPFPGYSSLPSTLHPYSYALNNPVNLVDPSGRSPILAALGIAGIIGGIGGAISHALSNPCQSLGDMLSSACFWQSVLVGQISGAIAGAVGWAVGAVAPGLMLKFGLTAKMTFGLAISLGGLSGSAASVAGQFTTNILLGKDPGEGLLSAAITGGIIGMVTGGVGYKLRQWLGKQLSSIQTSMQSSSNGRTNISQDSAGRWRNPDGTFAKNPNTPTSQPPSNPEGFNGNDLRSPIPTWLYKLINRASGQIEKYGITSEANPIARYGTSWLVEHGVDLVPVAIGQRWHMYELEYILNTLIEAPGSVHGH